MSIECQKTIIKIIFINLCQINYLLSFIVCYDTILVNFTVQEHAGGESLEKGVSSGENVVAEILNGLKEILFPSS